MKEGKKERKKGKKENYNYVPNISRPIYIKQKQTDLNGEININAIVGEFKTSLSLLSIVCLFLLFCFLGPHLQHMEVLQARG